MKTRSPCASRTWTRPSQTRGKQGYGEIRGIWQTVYLEAAPKTRLERAKIETKMDGRVRVLADRARAGRARDADRRL